MTNRRNRKKKPPLQPKLIALALLGFALGYYMLNFLSAIEFVFLGSTFHIVVGCALMAGTALYVGRALYKRFFEKKNNRKSRPVFLNDKKKSE
jgi:peptidoglycan/LPS O-acetylase OafA/YrhL